MTKKKEVNPRIAVATHAHSSVDFDVHFNHCSAIFDWSKKHDIRLLGYKGLCAADARELICESAIEQECTHIFILDADHIIPSNTLDNLLESKDEAMVSGLICRRFHPFDQVGWGKIDKRNTYVPIDIPLSGDLYQVGVCAFGCTLINLEKLQKLEKPWFRDTCVKNANGDLQNMRSDVNLCDSFRAIGEQVWIDSRVLVGHVGNEIVVYPQNKDYLQRFRFDYEESFKLKEGQAGSYGRISRVL
jgi:hypothetical protein